MPKIDIYASQITDLGVNLKKASNKVTDAYRLANSVSLSGIELSAKGSWLSQIAGIKGKMTNEANALARLGVIADSAAEQFEGTDSQAIKSTYGILDSLKVVMLSTAAVVKNLFTNVKVERTAKVNSIFLSSGTVLSCTLISWLKEALNRIREIIYGNSKDTSDDGSDGKEANGTGNSAKTTTYTGCRNYNKSANKKSSRNL